MFKRSFRSRDMDTSMTVDPQYRVDKASRLVRKGGVTTQGSGGPVGGSGARNPGKLAKLQRSLAGDNNTGDSQTSASRMQIDSDDLPPHQRARAPPPSSGNGGAGAVKSPGASAAKDFDPMLGPIVTMVVGPQRRLFAAHENVLCQVSFFEKILRSDYYLRLPADDATGRRIALPDEEPHALSAVLEYLYKGDYTPRLVHNKQRDAWELEDDSSILGSPSLQLGGGTPGGRRKDDDGATVDISSGQLILRDTVVYCGAERFGLEGLKRLALRKQGLRTGIDVGTILRSAQYCYANTPDSDVRLRAHYLAVIIRSRRVFKRSGTMQAEMERMGNGSDALSEGGGKLFFDLFVAMCNHLDDVLGAAGNARSPRTV